MSTLEERREARRRRRQQQDEEGELNGGYSADLEDRLARQRQEREERLQRIAAGVNAINGEDEFERRRRERREARLRQDQKSSGVTADEETTSTRRSRRRGTEDDIETEEVTTTRSRRRRGGEEDTTDSTPSAAATEEPEEDPEEAANRRREAIEAARRQAAEEEAERRQQEEEAERQAEEQRRADEERRRQIEEERRRREAEIEAELEHQQVERDDQERRISERIRKLQIEKDLINEDAGLYISEDPWEDNQQSATMSEERRKSEDTKTSKLKTFFEDRMEDAKNSSQTTDNQRRDSSNRRSVSSTPSFDESVQSMQERLTKFEASVVNSQKEPASKDRHVHQAKMLSPGTDRLKDIQKRFEGEKSDIERSSSRLGRLSASESHLNESPDFSRTGSKKVLNRWQNAVDPQKSPIRSSFTSTSASSVEGRGDSSSRKAGNITLLASKFNSSKDKNTDGAISSPTSKDISPLSPKSPLSKDVSAIRRQWSQQSDASDTVPEQSVKRQSSIGSKVTDRWQHKAETVTPKTETITPIKARSMSAASIKDYKGNASPVSVTTNGWRRSSSITDKEEEERERERIEREEAEREAAAKRMEEEAKKKKKRKGLGGLDPEKKKKLKDDDLTDSESDDEDEAPCQSQRDKPGMTRVAPLPADMNSMSKADLIKLCKNLHDMVAQLEEELYDWNFKIRKQDFEINSLTLKVNDAKGKFVKPVLRKVNKTESKFDKLKKDKSDFRSTLKSTGQSKYALDEEEEKQADKQQNWRDNLKKSSEGGEEAVKAES